jgi:hypothetical protein
MCVPLKAKLKMLNCKNEMDSKKGIWKIVCMIACQKKTCGDGRKSKFCAAILRCH